MSINRRQFLHRASLLAAGVVAADQLELVERLGWTRTLFTTGGGITPTLWGDGVHDDAPALTALCAGRAVYDERRRRLYRPGEHVHLSHDWYLVKSTIRVDGRDVQRHGRLTVFDGSMFEGVGDGPVFHFSRGYGEGGDLSYLSLHNVLLRGNAGPFTVIHNGARLGLERGE